MSTLSQASTQWASRPADERFCTLTELNEAMIYQHEHSRASVVSSRKLECIAGPDQMRDLKIVGPKGNEVNVSNWAFGQLATAAGAPAGFLRKLPAALAADNINWGLQRIREAEDVGIMLYQNGGAPELRCVTGATYGRIWNSTVSQALVDRFGDGITGDFRVPGEFGKEVVVTKNNTTIYGGDRTMFVFLAEEKNRITIPNRRDGASGDLARGFFVWNSEVGHSTLGISTFLFDYACKNRTVWGATQYQELRIRHTAAAPDKWLEQVIPAIEAYSHDGTATIVSAIEAARKARVEDVEAFLRKRKFSGSMIGRIKMAHMLDESRPMENLWDVSVGITAHARSIGFQDERVALEREAGLILDMA